MSSLEDSLSQNKLKFHLNNKDFDLLFDRKYVSSQWISLVTKFLTVTKKKHPMTRLLIWFEICIETIENVSSLQFHSGSQHYNSSLSKFAGTRSMIFQLDLHKPNAKEHCDLDMWWRMTSLSIVCIPQSRFCSSI